MEKIFFALLLTVFALSVDAYAAERFASAEKIKPEIAVKIDEGEASFLFNRKRVTCSHASHVLGCTRVRFYAVIAGSEITPDGELKKLSLQVGLRDVVIELSSELEKGTCLFDAVLKHELTHLALHRSVLKRFAPEIAKAVLSVAENFQPPFTQTQFNRIAKVLKDYSNRMVREDDRQNAMMDTTDAYAFQQKQCYQSGKNGK